VAELKVAYGELQRNVHNLFYSPSTVDVRELEETIEYHTRFPEEQASIVQSLSKNVKGRLLRREESYTETLFPKSGDEQTEEDGVLYLDAHHESEVYAFEENGANVSRALQCNVRAWCEATGLPTTITVRLRDRVSHLHKFPLVSRNSYFKKALQETKDVAVGEGPGRVEVFELALNFCYGVDVHAPPTVKAVVAAGSFLETTEELAGTVKAILGTCVSVGCTVDGKDLKDLQSEIDDGDATQVLVNAARKVTVQGDRLSFFETKAPVEVNLALAVETIAAPEEDSPAKDERLDLASGFAASVFAPVDV
jgi:hypothetical protein